jgi:putative spermidine/putrescine transport system permease protein
MTDATTTSSSGPMLSADGTPLKKSLQIALRRQKLRALALIAPLLFFVLISFIAPIADMLFRSVENDIVSETIPRTVIALNEWDYEGGNAAAPNEDVFAALYVDLSEAEEFKTHTRLGSRLNYETTGMSSLLRKTGRGIGRMDTDEYTKQFEALDPKWGEPATWVALMGSPGIAEALPETASAWGSWQRIVTNKNDVLAEEQPDDFIYTMLYRDLIKQPASAIAAYSGPRLTCSRRRTARLTGSNPSLSRRSFSTSTRIGVMRRPGAPSKRSRHPIRPDIFCLQSTCRRPLPASSSSPRTSRSTCCCSSEPCS